MVRRPCCCCLDVVRRIREMLSTLQYSSLQSRTMSNSGLCKTNNTSHGSWHVRRDRTSPSLHWDRPATARSPATKRNRPNNEIIGYSHPRLCTRARLCGIIPYTYNTNIDTTVVSSVNQSTNQSINISDAIFRGTQSKSWSGPLLASIDPSPPWSSYWYESYCDTRGSDGILIGSSST